MLATDIDEVSARETARAIGGQAWSVGQDVRDPASHRAVAQAASERGRLKLWVNNAGVLYLAPSWELTHDEVRRLIEVNVLGVVDGAHAAVEAMRDAGGQIINIASISSLAPAPGLAVYSATKHAVLGYSLGLQGDLNRAGLPIRVSAICPDAIDTDMVRNVADSKEAGLLFSAPKMLTAPQVADAVMDLVDKPRMMMTVPRVRGALVHALRPFPELGLRLLEPFRRAGERNLEKLGKR